MRLVRAPLHRARLRLRPPRVRQRRVTLRYGGDLTAALEDRVLPAMPSVAAFEQRLRELPVDEREAILDVADTVAAHRFDLLGSGPTSLGEQIPWDRDFKCGRRWPLAHVSRVPIIFPDESDIKVPWELSRFQHLPVLAAAWRLTGQAKYSNEIGAQLEAWISSNPIEFGPNWACTMDVAIRASNWVATLALLGRHAARTAWTGNVLESLLLHGRFIRQHLEWAEVRGNHYLSDVVGLLPVAALFGAGREGRSWAEWAAGELEAEMEHQVHADGCDHEASIPYHRLVTELMICGTQAVDALMPGRLPDSHRKRLDRMLAFTRDYTRPDGLAPQMGDADDGRFLPLRDYANADPRSHLHLFDQAGVDYVTAIEHAAYPKGGFWIMRSGDLYAIARCGDVGVRGLGSHAHNDQLSFELALGKQPLVVDPGSYVYTADLEERALFRSTSFHSTLRVGGFEQNPLRNDSPFTLDDRTRAELMQWQTNGPSAIFEGMHHGYERLDPPATHVRRIDFRGGERRITVTDTVLSDGVHELEWTFPLAPCEVRTADGRAVAKFDAGRLEIESPGLKFEVDDGWYSPSYGIRIPTSFLRASRASRPGRDVTTFRFRAFSR
jgi:uncharacterized heparinase superfamily protein